MNWKHITIKITIINALGWIFLEVWSRHYAKSNVMFGAGTLIVFHLLTYYIILISSEQKPELEKEGPVTPVNCPGHDWQPSKYSKLSEECVKCKAERGKSE